MTAALEWLRKRDAGFGALRRAGRAAIVMPALFAIGDKGLSNPALATFAAFGSFAMLLLVDFGGSIRDRLLSQVALGVAGATLVSIGTLVSRETWLATVAMAVVGFGVLFAGVVSSVLAGASVSLLLAFILPVSLPAPDSSIPDRLAGWGIASAASLLAVSLLWPSPAADRLRGAAVAAFRALAAHLRADAAYHLEGGDVRRAEREEAAGRAAEATGALQRTFLATPYRPTGLSTSARAIVRLVDEVAWLDAILARTPPDGMRTPAHGTVCTLKSAAAAVLDSGAELLADPRQPGALRAAVDDLRQALSGVERVTTLELPFGRSAARAEGGPGVGEQEQATAVISALDPSFRAQELAFAVLQLAGNVDLAAAAERRSWLERSIGRRPDGLPGTIAAAHQRAAAHLEPHSVWLHNSLRGATGLGLAVLIASLTGVQHSFWVVLGALSVLRSNALSTGQNIVRGLLGTAGGVVVGAALLALIGTNTTVLWLLLPCAILVAGFAPAAISFAAGQAAFTVTLVILYNIIQPTGWRVGLLRIEDVAIGFGVSLAVGLLVWPRGAGPALGRELAEAYSDSARYLEAAVEFGVGRCDRTAANRVAPADEAGRAAASARRLDDAFRTFLAERAAKLVPLAEVTGLVNGVAGLRLAADAVLDLWERDRGDPTGDRSAARTELLAISGAVAGWYEDLASSLAGGRSVPEALGAGEVAVVRLVEAVDRDLRGKDGRASEVGVRIVWTGDHLDAARRLQGVLVEPARTVNRRLLAVSAPRFPVGSRARRPDQWRLRRGRLDQGPLDQGPLDHDRLDHGAGTEEAVSSEG